MASSFLVPAVLLALAALAAQAGGSAREELSAFLRVYPWLVLGAGVILGLRFRRGRVVFAVAAIALADRLLLRFGPVAAPGAAAQWAFDAAAFLLPLDLAWLCAARERGTLNPTGFLRACALAAQPAGVSFLWLAFKPRLVEALAQPVAPGGAAPHLPDAALAAFAAALALVAVLAVLRRTPLEAGFGWAIVACFLALRLGPPGTPYFATAELILVVALLESTFAMAFRDALTSLPSRRAFDEAVEKLVGSHAIAMVDIDHFKAVNDRWGHDVGDQVLRMVASRLAAAAAGGRAYRVGGEEFALVFTNRTAKEVHAALEAIRREVADSPFALRSPDRPARRPKRPSPQKKPPIEIAVTVSIGVAHSGGRLPAPEDVLRAADERLYEAKRSGRNRVCG